MRRVLIIPLLLCASPAWAKGGDFDACDEFFIAPIFISSHAGTGGEVVVGAAPIPRVEIRAKLDGKKDAKEVLLSPPDLMGDIAAIGTLWPEKGSPGQWMAAHTGDSIDIQVVGYPARKETTLGRLRIHLGDVLGSGGYALFSISNDRVFALNVAASAYDGTRYCHGLKSHQRPTWTVPHDSVIARPPQKMLEAALSAAHCVGSDCDPSLYSVEYRDVDGDGTMDAVLRQHQADASNLAIAIWTRDTHGDFQPAFAGSCADEFTSLSRGKVRCALGDKMTVLEFSHGRIHERAATVAEEQALVRADSEERGAEASGNLRAIYLAEQGFHDKWHRFTDSWEDLDFRPDAGYYGYYLSNTGRHTNPSASPSGHDVESIPAHVFCSDEGDTSTVPGLSGSGSEQVITIVAVGARYTSGLDCWSISSTERVIRKAAKIPAGEPHHHSFASDPSPQPGR